MIARFGPWRGMTLGLALATVPLLGGCAKEDGLDRQEVSGKVTLDGVPLPTGSIQFQPDGGVEVVATAEGASITDGAYRIEQAKGLLPGSYRVIIMSHDNKAFLAEEAPGGGVKGLPPELIPPQYNVKTTLVSRVSADKENVFDYELKKKP